MGTGWPVPISALKKLYYLKRNEVYLSLRGLQLPSSSLVGVVYMWLRVSLNIVRRQDHPVSRLFVLSIATWHGVTGRLGQAPAFLDKWLP